MEHAILAGIGIIAIRTAWGGLYLNFVKPGLRWWLLAAGAVVLAMGRPLTRPSRGCPQRPRRSR